MHTKLLFTTKKDKNCDIIAAIWEKSAIFAFKKFNSNLKYGKEKDPI